MKIFDFGSNTQPEPYHGDKDPLKSKTEFALESVLNLDGKLVPLEKFEDFAFNLNAAEATLLASIMLNFKMYFSENVARVYSIQYTDSGEETEMEADVEMVYSAPDVFQLVLNINDLFVNPTFKIIHENYIELLDINFTEFAFFYRTE